MQDECFSLRLDARSALADGLTAKLECRSAEAELRVMRAAGDADQLDTVSRLRQAQVHVGQRDACIASLLARLSAFEKWPQYVHRIAQAACEDRLGEFEVVLLENCPKHNP